MKRIISPVTPEVTIVKLPDRMTVEQLADIADPNVPLAKLWKEEQPYIEKLMKDIEVAGIKRPVTVVVYPDGRMKLWEGHHRLVAAQKLGLKDIPTKFVGPTDAPITEFILEQCAIHKAEVAPLKKLKFSRKKISLKKRKKSKWHNTSIVGVRV